MTLTIKAATNADDLAAAKTLFREYADWLGVDLCFQGFEAEMVAFPATYKQVYVAVSEGVVIGTVALKHLSDTRCEMKRLYVLPAHQNIGAGRALCEYIIKEARALGYKEMVLDSLERLQSALRLYRSLGFTDCRAYTENPEADVVYLALNL